MILVRFGRSISVIALARDRFRYPFPQSGVQQDVRAGMAVSYSEKPAG